MKHQSKSTRQEGGFNCVHCRCTVPFKSFGTKQRNHCPMCLWSRHVDDKIGDRRSPCAQPMEPIAIASRSDGEWSVVHKCNGCGQLRTNRIAGDDDELALLALALRPISAPAFPLDAFPQRGALGY